MMHDSGGPRRVKPMLERLGAKVWDPDKVVLITDHYLPANDEESKRIIHIARHWAASEGVQHFYDRQGICHVVLPERGQLRPGMFVVGGDSHSPTGGAFGAGTNPMRSLPVVRAESDAPARSVFWSKERRSSSGMWIRPASTKPPPRSSGRSRRPA